MASYRMVISTPFKNLSPNETVIIEVTAVSNNNCPSVSTEFTCSTLLCPDIELDLLPIEPICFEAGSPAFDLDFQLNGASGTGTFSWSGPGLLNTTTGNWQANADMIGQDNWIIVEYEEETCSYSDSINIQVFAIPVANFNYDEEICVNSTSTFTFSGTAGSTAAHIWLFENGSPSTAIGPGPHAISWDAPGNYEISLEVEENGCTSEVAIGNVQVDEALEMPEISCSATYNSIIFSWNEVPNALSYELEIPLGLDATNLSSTEV